MKKAIFYTIYTLGSIVGWNRSGVTVIGYHSLGTRQNKYSVNIREFKRQIKKLKKSYEFISIDSAIKSAVNRQSVVLTIDDGYEDVLNVIDFLLKEKIPVALFVLANPKKANRKEIAHPGKLLSINQIRKLSYKGVTIGCHSATHADLTKISEKELREEVIESKKTLEKELGIQISYFAYPKGLFNEKVTNVVRKAGYRAAFSVMPGSLTYSSLYTIPRTVITRDHTHKDFPELISNTSFFVRNIIHSISFKKV